MVYLNENMSINIKSLEIEISNKLKRYIDEELDHLLNEKTLERVKINIIKKIKNRIKEDNFMYSNEF